LNASLILVRHAAPNVDKTVLSTRWTLSPEGRTASLRLAGNLVPLGPKAIVSSPEPKALETALILAQRLNLRVTPDDGLVEHRRPDLGFTGREEFESAVRTMFENPSERLFGGESADESCQRFERALACHAARPLVVVTHGTVLTLFVSRNVGLDPMTLWTSLRLPEALVLDSKMHLLARWAV
jgi:broad specificity phosphatase PhoE